MRTHDRKQADSFMEQVAQWLFGDAHHFATYAYVNPWHARMTDFIDTLEERERKEARKRKTDRPRQERPVMRS